MTADLEGTVLEWVREGRSSEINALLATPLEDEILMLARVGPGPVDSALVAAVMCVSVNHASTALGNMARRGLLRRERVNDPTGGKKFNYYACVCVRRVRLASEGIERCLECDKEYDL